MSRSELALWVSLILLANTIFASIVATLAGHGGLGDLAQLGVGGLFDAIAWGVAIWRLATLKSGPARGIEVAAAALLVLFGSVSQPLACPAALTGSALWLLLTRGVGERAVATLFLAIASHQLWSHLIFAALAPEIVKLDASMVGEAVTMTVRGATWKDNIITVPNGHAIAVLEGCSSFANVSTALLAWVAFAKLERLEWVAKDLWVGAATLMVQVLLNVARMYLIAQSLPYYLYWHDGVGAQIYVAIASAAAVLISVLGTRWATPRR